MPKKRTQREEIEWLDRPVPGEEGQWLALWLREGSTPERKRIVSLLQCFQSVLAGGDSPKLENPIPEGQKYEAAKDRMRIMEANGELDRYVSRPQIFVKAGKRLYIGHLPTEGRHTNVDEEWLAVDCLVRLADQDRLDRLRKCVHCSRWFFARKMHKKFCIREHQQAYFRSTPKFKSARAPEAKKLYRINSPVTRRTQKLLGLTAIKRKGRNGVTIVDTQFAHIARASGFQVGDIICAVDGKPVNSPVRLANLLELKRGRTVYLKVRSKGRLAKKTLMLKRNLKS